MITVYHIREDFLRHEEYRDLQHPLSPDAMGLYEQTREPTITDDEKRALWKQIRDINTEYQKKLVANAFRDGAYEAVAEVEADSLEAAFQLTENSPINESWSLKPLQGVNVLVGPHTIDGKIYGRRSTYVGDVMRKDGELHIVASIGFIALEETIADPV